MNETTEIVTRSVTFVNDGERMYMSLVSTDGKYYRISFNHTQSATLVEQGAAYLGTKIRGA